METNKQESDSCGCPPKAEAKFRLRDIFKKSAACCCGSAAGGFLLGHASCLITPVAIAFSGAALAGTGAGILAVGISAAVTAAGLALWHKLRGHKADKAEKRNVWRGALIGFGLSAVFNLTVHRNHHAGHADHLMDPRMRTGVATCRVPVRDTVPAVKIDTASAVKIDTAAVRK